MAVNVVGIGSVRKLLSSTTETKLVESPRKGILRIVTRLMFENYDSSSHTPTFYIVEDDHDRWSSETPEKWRLHYPRSIAASGGLYDECGTVAIVGDTQSMAVELASDPSDTSDETVWPAVTAHWLDQYISDDFAALQDRMAEQIFQRFGISQPPAQSFDAVVTPVSAAQSQD